MRVFWVIVLLVWLMDVLACFVYCSYKNTKSIKEMIRNNTSEISSQGLPKRYKKTKILQGIIMCIFMWMESILRVNILVTGYIPSHHIRNFFYKNVFKVHLEKNVVIYYGAEIRSPWNLYIGEGTVIGDKAILDARNGIYIGKNVNFSTGVWIWTLQHDVNDCGFGTANEGGAVTIGDRAWISCRTVVLPKVTIGEGAVIAAGGVVTKSTDCFTICGGVPCKQIGKRNQEIDYCFEGRHMHFF